jgi:hypothetical protein
MPGNVESGVRADLAKLDIAEPRSALDFLAIALAASIDRGDDERSVASLARELRLTLAAIHADGTPAADRLDAMTDGE